MMGAEGLKDASIYAILNANYLASLLKDNYGIVFTNHNKKVGHELILDCRELKRSSGIDENDIAKRIMDFGYHAPTLSFPVHETLMIEPTESESLSELNRFINVMNCIYSERKEIENNVYPKDNNVLKNAPHPQYIICGDEWNFPYSRKKAAFALEYLEENKFMINVARIDNACGDRNLIPTLKE